MFEKKWNFKNNPDILVNKTIYLKDDRVFDIKGYSPDRGFTADELVWEYDEDTNEECCYYREYPGYLTKYDVSGAMYYEI